MKTGDLRKLQADELEARIRDLRDGLFNMRIKHATGQIENSADLRGQRRDLARALTVQGERERAESAGGEA
jgi:large subunit ribosomal protein L29